MGRARELERKFTVTPGFVMPSLAGIRGVAAAGEPAEYVLDAIYYDTDDLALLRNGVTLRRREGGPDAAWHLKLPAAADARDEISRPITTGVASPQDDRIPDDLADLVLVHTRGRPLRPIARLETQRRAVPLTGPDGSVVAEVVDDTVRGRTLGERVIVSRWREIEVEVAADHLDQGAEILDGAAGALRRAGARPGRTPSKLARVVGALTAPGEPAGTAGRTGGAGLGTGGADPGLTAARPGLTAARPGRGRSTGKASKGKSSAGTSTGRSSRGKVSAGKAASSADRAGIRDLGTPAGIVIGDYLAAQLAELRALDPEVRLDTPDAIHRMRVATRRLRATLRTFAPLFDPARARSLEQRLRRLGVLLGEPRDAEVQLERFLGAVADQPVELVLGPVTARMEETLRSRRLHGHDQVLAHLRDDEYLTLIDDLTDFVDDRAQTRAALRPAGEVLPGLVHRVDRGTRRRAARALNASRTARAHLAGPRPEGAPAAGVQTEPADIADAAYHSARKSAKRLRYAAEAVEPVIGKEAKRTVRRAKKAQQLLGDYQDSVVARQLLRDFGVAANLAGESSFTYGLLLGDERRHGQSVLADFGARWPELSARRERRWLRSGGRRRLAAQARRARRHT